MKKIIVTAGLGAAVTIGSLLGAGTAEASSSSFLYAAHNAGFSNVGTGDYGILNDGYRACNMLTSGWTWSQTVNEIWVNENMTYGDAVQFVNISAAHLC